VSSIVKPDIVVAAHQLRTAQTTQLTCRGVHELNEGEDGSDRVRNLIISSVHHIRNVFCSLCEAGTQDRAPSMRRVIGSDMKCSTHLFIVDSSPVRTNDVEALQVVPGAG